MKIIIFSRPPTKHIYQSKGVFIMQVGSNELNIKKEGLF